MNARTPLLTMTLAVAILAMISPAQAIYIETPLTLEPDAERADAGDQIDFQIEPNPENRSAKKDWAGKTVQAGYSYDKNEGKSGEDAPTNDEGYIVDDLATITLDDEARGTITWEIPQELDGYNLAIFLEDDDGERLALARLAVGDAPEQMHIMSGPSDGEPEGDEKNASEDDDAGAATEAPALPLFGLVVAIGAAAVALGLRRH